MATCRLCLTREADKKGSHIVPFFLLKGIESLEGKKGRDNELGFSINGIRTTSYFGRGLQPEELEKFYGKITEEDIESKSTPLDCRSFFLYKL